MQCNIRSYSVYYNLIINIFESVDGAFYTRKIDERLNIIKEFFCIIIYNNRIKRFYLMK